MGYTVTKTDLVFLNPTETIEQLSDYYFPPYITLAHIFNAPRGWSIASRTLKQYQIQYVVSGLAEYCIENRVYTTRQGDLLIHRPNERHSVNMVDNEPYVCISIVFHFGASPFPFDEYITRDNYVGNYSNQSIEKKLAELVTFYQQPGAIHQIRSQNVLMQVLSEIAVQRKEPNEKSTIQQINKSKVAIVKNYILDHYAENIDHDQLEQISGLSTNYMITQFKKVIGLTPMQYLIWVRIEKAKELAIQTSLSVGEIANRVGYADVHTFGKMFKKKTGYSLKQFCGSLICER
jgi:AraC-like DNA-binding protein